MTCLTSSEFASISRRFWMVNKEESFRALDRLRELQLLSTIVNIKGSVLCQLIGLRLFSLVRGLGMVIDLIFVSCGKWGMQAKQDMTSPWMLVVESWAMWAMFRWNIQHTSKYEDLQLIKLQGLQQRDTRSQIFRHKSGTGLCFYWLSKLWWFMVCLYGHQLARSPGPGPAWVPLPCGSLWETWRGRPFRCRWMVRHVFWAIVGDGWWILMVVNGCWWTLLYANGGKHMMSMDANGYVWH